MPIIVVMGVSGSGKSTIATLLARELGCPFKEGDAFHPPANVEKMKSGTPLTDEDRWPWLERIAAEIAGWRITGGSGIVTCSALKRAYRQVLTGGEPDVTIVYLKGDRAVIEQRLKARRGHFMPVTLLDSQFAILQEPGEDERAIAVDVGPAPPAIVAEIVRRLNLEERP
jgi:gluconokinase